MNQNTMAYIIASFVAINLIQLFFTFSLTYRTYQTETSTYKFSDFQANEFNGAYLPYPSMIIPLDPENKDRINKTIEHETVHAMISEKNKMPCYDSVNGTVISCRKHFCGD